MIWITWFTIVNYNSQMYEKQTQLKTMLNYFRNKFTVTNITRASSLAVLIYTSLAFISPQRTPIFYSAKWWKRKEYPNEAMIPDSNQASNPNQPRDNVKAKRPKWKFCSSDIEPASNEFRIILIGSTGSGKSSAGNKLLKEDNGFDTSPYAKSKTTKSILKTRKEKDSDAYKVDIIDTPAVPSTELTEKEVEIEIQKAVALSSPGPHAFLLCIPSTAKTYNYADVIRPYKKLFGDDIYHFIIVAFTKYDLFENESNLKSTSSNQHGPTCKIFDINEQNSILRKTKDSNMSNAIFLGGNSKTDELNQVIKLIKEIGNESKGTKYARCDLSDHAEIKLQEQLIELKIDKRDEVKKRDDYLKHFSPQFCKYCKEFNTNE